MTDISESSLAALGFFFVLHQRHDHPLVHVTGLRLLDLLRIDGDHLDPVVVAAMVATDQTSKSPALSEERASWVLSLL